MKKRYKKVNLGGKKYQTGEKNVNSSDKKSQTSVKMT